MFFITKKSISFILILALFISIIGYSNGTISYAENQNTGSGINESEKVDSDLNNNNTGTDNSDLEASNTKPGITRPDTEFSEETTIQKQNSLKVQDSSNVYNLASAKGFIEITNDNSKMYLYEGGSLELFSSFEDGIILTGELNPSLYIVLNGAKDSRLNVILSDAAIDTVKVSGNSTSAIQLINGADSTLTLIGNNSITTTNGAVEENAGDNQGGAGIEVTSPQSLLITGSGFLTAKGASCGAGIGGKYGTDGSNITIAGRANVTAVSGSHAAAIGGGAKAKGSDIDISGSDIKICGNSVVEATGVYYGAGIGGGELGAAHDIEITEDAEVHARGGGGGNKSDSGNGAAGIGGGGGSKGGGNAAGSGKNITISGNSKVTAEGGYRATGIGGGYQGLGENIKIIDNASVSAIGLAGAAGIGCGDSKTGRNITISDNANVYAVGGYNPADRGAGIGGGAQANFTNIVIDGGTVYAKGGSFAAGIGGGFSGSAINITISGVNTKVDAIGGERGAGIGGGQWGSGTDITIEGGTVNATGGTSGAGIGGGVEGDGKDINISGGTVNANGGTSGAGIGGGNFGSGTDITIKDGTVNATGGYSGAGIGGGYEGYAKGITISNGFVTAEGDFAGGADDIGNGVGSTTPASGIKILGGSIHLINDKFGCQPTNNDKNEYVYKVTVPAVKIGSFSSLRGHQMIKGLPYSDTKTISSGSIEHGDTFPADKASAYIYLPDSSFDGIEVGTFSEAYANVNANPTKMNQNIVLWKGTIPISFDGNGTDDVSPASKNTKFGEAYGELATATRAGYSFEGWYTSTSGVTEITSASIVDTQSPATLYALWNPCTYTAIFDTNGGQAVSPTSKVVTYAAAYGTLPTPTRANFEFSGWYTEASGGNQVTDTTAVNIANDHTLYAHWKSKSVTVTFEPGAGGYVNPPSKTVTPESIYGDLPTPTKTGHGFVGWYTEAIDGDKVENTTTVTSTTNHALYAHWTANTYTLTYDKNGGDEISQGSKPVIYGTQYGEHPVAKKKGYSFTGWYTAKSGGVEVLTTDIVKLEKNTTLYAHWEAKTYKITFKANAKKVKKLKPKTKMVKYDSKLGKLPKPKKTGYKFKGWYTKKKGGSKITSKSIMKYDKSIKLYAKWAKNGKIVKCKSAYIRKNPGKNQAIKGYAKKGQKVCIIKKIKHKSGHIWYKVKVGKMTGYVYGKYIKKI